MLKSNQLHRLTVLYVEDEAEVREELSDILSLEIGTLYTTSNGQEALEVIKKHKIDLIITDIQIPIMNGLETPIIITTGFNKVAFLREAIELHVDQYVSKPVDIPQLFSAITRAATVILQKRELEQRDEIMQSVLHMKPYYTLLVDSDHLSKIHQDILHQLNFKDGDEIEVKAGTVEGQCDQIATIEDVLQAILITKNDLGVIDNVCVRKKTQPEKSYIIKPYFFEDTELFMLVFFDNESIVKNSEFEKCAHCLDLTCSSTLSFKTEDILG